MSSSAFVPSQPRASVLVRFRGRLFGLIPFGVWLACIAAVLWLAKDRAQPLDYPGMALVAEHSVAAPSSGVLVELLVDEAAVVRKGAVIGRLSGDGLELRSQKVQHAISQLRAEMARERELQRNELAQAQVNQQNEAEIDARRFARDVENARLDLLQVQVRVEESRIRLAGLKIELERQQGLSKQSLFSEAELIRTRTEHDALGERIQRTEAVITGRQEKLAAVQTRLADYRVSQRLEGPDMDLVLGAYSWRISLQQDELLAIAAERQGLVLRASADGRVTKLLVQVGQRLVAGQIVLHIIDARPRGLVTYVPESAVSRVGAGMRVVFELSTRPGLVVESRVLSIGPTVVEVPVQLQSVARVREWRVPVRLLLTDAMLPLPGESLRVRILSHASD